MQGGGEGQGRRDERVDGVWLHHYAASTKLILDKGRGGVWSENADIECFANAGHTVSLVVEGIDGGKANEGDDEGHCFVTLSPAEARWLAKQLIGHADKAEREKNTAGR